MKCRCDGAGWPCDHEGPCLLVLKPYEQDFVTKLCVPCMMVVIRQFGVRAGEVLGSFAKLMETIGRTARETEKFQARVNAILGDPDGTLHAG